MKTTKLSFVLLSVMLVCTIFFQMRFLEERFGDRLIVPGCPWCDAKQKGEDVVYLPVSTSVVKLFTPADLNFLADMIWMRTTYYFGKHALTDRQYPYMLHLLDMITDLSPRWEIPYLFGAVIIPMESEALPVGSVGGSVDEYVMYKNLAHNQQALSNVVYIIDKGLTHHPDTWELWFFKGYYLWKSKGEIDKASEAFYKASICPNAPRYLANLSATIATRAGKRELAIRFLQEALKTIQDPEQQKMILRKLQGVMREDEKKHGSSVE